MSSGGCCAAWVGYHRVILRLGRRVAAERIAHRAAGRASYMGTQQGVGIRRSRNKLRVAFQAGAFLE